jgi:ABC-type polysaccharide/polyol phosphate transport system, ATPase component
MAQITLENAWVEFPVRKAGSNTNFAALNDISLDLKSGDRLGIMGPNGSGKTTLLRVLTGIYPPTRGTYSSSGDVGSMLDLNAGINAKSSGRDNIMFRSKLLGRSKSLSLATVEDACEFGGLAEFIDQPVETYSSGMKMKLSFALATAVHPEILIMDEWLSVGDESFQAKARERINSLVDQAEILVLASHSKDLLRSTCNRFISLDRGNLTQHDEIE